MVRALKPIRSVKAAKEARAALRVIRRVTIRTRATQPHEPTQHSETLDGLEAEHMKARLTPGEETKRRNEESQNLPQSKRRKRKDSHADANEAASFEFDKFLRCHGRAIVSGVRKLW
ncbi:hypothetical protein F441_00550 [Phytophthora nicotianae CJ01A1]|uniref:Uncharacterized protein n=2 Tax=Phytophthora nicotianae CJ01A1 TaxID=1317063 RepID=W2XVY5_PHYNI|nr:hypothetical protein F441_00550 [Phytophthora nicotianae CJ01A1]